MRVVFLRSGNPIIEVSSASLLATKNVRLGKVFVSLVALLALALSRVVSSFMPLLYDHAPCDTVPKFIQFGEEKSV